MIIMNRLTIAMFGLLFPWMPIALAQDSDLRVSATTITIDAGQIQGLSGEMGLSVYVGIPYAAPPVGDLRWKPPMPARSWDGVRQCTTYGPPPIQTLNPESGSEDCLYLNVWTTAKARVKQPVMLWIHGGGFTNGFSNNPAFEGSHFARKGIVFVSINYRVGVMGFFAHPALSAESEHQVSGNYGILDQIAALRWIQKNIAAFGGDPQNVTILGESAGATSAYVLIASPLAKGLFQRAVLQSPWLTRENILHLNKETFAGRSAEFQNSERVKKLFGDSSNVLAKLREMTAAEATSKLSGTSAVLVDGHLLSAFPYQIYANGKQNPVAAIAGTNRDEGTAFANWKPVDSMEAYQQKMRDEFGDHSKLVFDLYGVQRFQDARGALISKVTDHWFVHPTREFLRSMTRIESACWQYEFAHRSLVTPYLGATHGAEIPFVFNNIDRDRKIGTNQKVADAMIQYWVQFAKSGDPNSEGLPNWPRYTQTNNEYLVIGREIVSKSGLRSDACDVYDKVVAAIRKSGPLEDSPQRNPVAKEAP